MRLVATSIIQQRRSLVIAVAVVSAFILLWLSLSSRPCFRYTLPNLPSLSGSHSMPIPFSSNSRLLPFRYWNHRTIYPEKYTDNSCMKFPAVSDLQYASSSWQLVKVESGNVYVYAAYYDDRFEEPMVRVLIYTDVFPVPKMYCQLWFPDDNEPQTELATPLYGWHPGWGGPTDGVNEPYILGCKCRRHNPDKDIPPIATAVVTAPCGVATNVLDIQNAPFDAPSNAPFNAKSEALTDAPLKDGPSVAVCVKWLHFRNDVSVRVIEWMQLMKHFGAEKVYLYIIRLHPNTRKVLKYYEDLGFAVVTELSHPPQVSGFTQDRMSQDFRDMRRELLPLNDCLYRNIGKHDWLAVIDVDEIIVPTPEETWSGVIKNQTAESGGNPFDALVYPNYFVLDGAQKDLVGPPEARLLSHTWRAREPSPGGWCVKSFFNVSSVTAMHNHTPMSCKNDCRSVGMDDGPGKMLHFRARCSYDTEDCEALHDVIKEDNLGKWRAPVLAEMTEILQKLGLESFENNLLT